jgi:hypothetical protein
MSCFHPHINKLNAQTSSTSLHLPSLMAYPSYLTPVQITATVLSPNPGNLYVSNPSRRFPISLPCEHHTTFNHALNFHAAMHAICPGAPHHHHDAIGGPVVHCASDQHTVCKLQRCALRLHPSRCPFVVPSTLAAPQRPLCFVASPFTVGRGNRCASWRRPSPWAMPATLR